MSKQNIKQRRLQEEAERLNSPVNLNGVGEDKVIQDLLSPKFVEGTNVEAAEIAMALRQLITGQSLLLQNQQRQSEEIAKVRQRMSEMDKDAEKWETDKQAFLQEVADKADRIRTTNPDQIIAKGAILYQDALVQAKAEANVDKMKFHETVAHMPMETVISPGELVTFMENKMQVNKIIPETVRIKDMQWVLQPGIPTEVPKIVAEALRNRRRIEEESRARGEMMGKNLEQGVFQQRWSELNSKYNSPTQ